jgi:predicted nucleic acid-binding protein
MKEFSLNNTSNKIYFKKTKIYFEEVKKSYSLKNYRSAVVMLYSIVICDLVYKLQELKDRFNDVTSEKILIEIEKIQKENPANPIWESKLVELIKERSSLLSTSDYSNIIMLQKHRHLSAHPVLEDNYELYQPNEETTLAHIRNITEGILIKPPLFTKKIVYSILEDLEAVTNIFINEDDDESLERYLNSKYLKHAPKTVIVAIFKSLWKIVYKVEDERCNKNRVINSKAIRLLYRKYPTLLFDSIKDEINYFSDISHQRPIYFLIGFLSQHQEIYNILNESTKVLIQRSTDEDRVNKSMAWFLFSGLKNHKDWIMEEEEVESLNTIHLNTIKAFYKAYIEAGLEDELYSLLIWLFSKSSTQQASNNRYSFISYILPKLNKNYIENVLKAVDSNILNQNINAQEIKQHSDIILGTSFDYSLYPCFQKLSE